MFDAISNFIAFLRESIDKSNDPDEIVRLETILDKAERIKERLLSTAAAPVQSA